MIPRPFVTKIPGELIKTKADKYNQDLTKLTKFQLLEIKEREENLLSKKSQLARLPDKGQKIKDFYEKVLKEISQHDEIENAARLFSELNIVETGQEKLTNLEWTGNLNSERKTEILLDSDDEETNPLKIIAQSTDMKKHIKYIQSEPKLITEQDLKDIDEFKKESDNDNSKLNIDSELVDIKISTEMLTEKIIESKLSNSLSSSQYETASSNSSLNLEPHTLYLMEKSIDVSPKKEKFLPFKTTKSNVHDPDKEKNRKIGGKYWEITAATPPPMQNSGAKLLSLKDSVEIQIDYLEKLKKLQEKQTEERLATKAALRKTVCDIILPDEQIRKVNKFFGSYRHHHDLSSEESDDENGNKFDSDEGVHDDEDEKGGSVTFKVYD